MHPYREQYLLPPDADTDLRNLPTRDEEAFLDGKSQGCKRLDELSEELSELQHCLYAEHKRRLLVVLQGMDTSGKNGTVRNVFRRVSPQAVHVASFTRPTPIELDHDYLWRIHHYTPARGEIVIFDRSHYEDVTAVRVNELAPESVWKKRFKHINDFEEMLFDEGTVILKFMLHISQDEQKSRLKSRLANRSKQWKFDHSDIIARAKWEEYMDAYNDVLNLTNKPHAPWFVIPSDQKWLRNLIVAEILVDVLKEFEMKFPEPDFDPKTYEI